MVRLKAKSPDELKREVVLSGYSQTEMAHHIGVSKGHLSAVLNGRETPGPKTAKAIVDLINSNLGTDHTIADVFSDISVAKT